MRRAARVLCHFYTRAALPELQPTASAAYIVSQTTVQTTTSSTGVHKQNFNTVTGENRIRHMSTSFLEVFMQTMMPLCTLMVCECYEVLKG